MTRGIFKTLSFLIKRYPYCRNSVMLWSRRLEPPFRVLIGTILSQRSRDETTEKVAARLFAKYPDARAIAKASLKELERTIKPSGPYHQKAHNIKRTCEILVGKYGGRVPEKLDELLALPGVGQKTADCVLLYGYGKPVIPVDTHVHKMANLLGWVRTKRPEQTKHALEKMIRGRVRASVNCALVSLGQETRYNKEKLVKILAPVVPDIGRRYEMWRRIRRHPGRKQTGATVRSRPSDYN